MKRKQKRSDIAFKRLSSPYQLKDSDTFEVICERYLRDPDKTREINGKTFWKVIQSTLLEFNDSKIIEVAADNQIGLIEGDILSDENGHKYRFKGTEMFYFREFPIWESKIGFILLESEVDNIGQYISKIEVVDNVVKV